MISENICIGLLVKYLSVGILKTFECHIFTKPQDCLPLDIQNIATVALTNIWAGQVVRGTNPLKNHFFFHLVKILKIAPQPKIITRTYLPSHDRDA